MSTLPALLALLDLESLAALVWAFLTPSENGRGVFLWLSQERLILVVILLLILLGLVSATWYLWRAQGRTPRVLLWLDDWCLDQRQLAATLLALVTLPAALAVGLIAVLRTPLDFAVYGLWAPDTFPLLHAVMLAALPLLVFLMAASIQAAAFLVIHFSRNLGERETWSRHNLGGGILWTLIAVTTLFHWIVLAFQLRFFVNIPAWYWIYAPVPFSIGDLWFTAGALLLFGAAFWALFIRRRVTIGLLLIALLGGFLQFGVGLMGAGGMAALRDRYFSTYHADYVLKASSSDLSLLDTVRQYERFYGTGSFTGTKPPGLMVFYTALDHIANGFPSALPDAVRFARLSNVVVWLFPLLAVSMVGLLYAFARRFLDDETGLIPRLAPLLYVLAPTVALFTFFPDQAIYPLAFLLGAWFAVAAIRRHSLVLALLLGAFLYVAAFFAFSMLPLYVFAGLYLLLHHWREGAGSRLRPVIVTGLAIAAGTLALHLLSVAALGYNVLPRFQHTMAINHNFDFYLRVGLQPTGQPESLGSRLGQILNAAWVNNLDFAAGIGFPFYILAFAQAVRLIARGFKAGASQADIILLALVGSFLVLNLAGTAQGEVPRLWMFWLPMFALLAAYELAPQMPKRPFVLIIFGLAQLITLMLTFHFQDLRM